MHTRRLARALESMHNHTHASADALPRNALRSRRRESGAAFDRQFVAAALPSKCPFGSGKSSWATSQLSSRMARRLLRAWCSSSAKCNLLSCSTRAMRMRHRRCGTHASQPGLDLCFGCWTRMPSGDTKLCSRVSVDHCACGWMSVPLAWRRFPRTCALPSAKFAKRSRGAHI